MKISSILFSLFWILISQYEASSQISFTDQTDKLVQKGTRSTIPAAISDFDGDFMDDLLRLSDGRILYLEYQRNSYSYHGDFIGNIGGNANWMAIAGDLDQDGINEIVTGGSYNAVKIYKKNEEKKFELWQITNDDFFAQGSNVVDINNDGWLDLFVCDDDGESDIWLNDGTGQLFEQDDFINFITDPPSDNSGNYGSEWIDIDNDNDLDLYIAKCRAGVNDPADPRRINALFINDGQNVFEEKAKDFDLAISAQSWSANFDDLDNDGDLDAFIINHDVPYMILENREGKFVDVSSSSLATELAGQGLQSVIRDFDNNGFSDILIGGNQDYILWNNGNLSFDIADQTFGAYEAHTFAVGDLNNDGFWDVFTGHGENINQAGLVDDALWINEGNDNEFIVISLLGDSSNLNGIGACLKLYGSFGQMTRTVRAGEGYGVCHSFNQIFGLGVGNSIDSLVIHWPSGLTDVFKNLEKNQKYIAHEGKCIQIRPDLTLDKNSVICAGDSVRLTAPVGFSYFWSSGQITQEIIVKESGNYFVKLTDENACINFSNPVDIIKDSGEDIPIINFLAGDTLSCHNEPVILASDHQNIVMWSNGMTENNIEITEDGDYFLSAEGQCFELFSDTLHIRFFEPESPLTKNDTILKGENAYLIALGDSIHWFENEFDILPILIGDTLIAPSLEETTSYYTRDLNRMEFGSYQAGQAEQLGSSHYASNNVNGEMIFNVYAETVIQSVDVFTDTPGEREIQIFNQAQEIVFSKSFDLPTGKSVLTLNALLRPGENYVMTTNTNLNEQVLGFVSPRLERSKEGTNYPYVIPNLISLEDSNFGPQYFYYFFNWIVKKTDEFCLSDAVEVTAVVESPSNVLDLESRKINIFPNPLNAVLNLKFSAELPDQISIIGLEGKEFVQILQVNPFMKIDISDLSNGAYILRFYFNSKSENYKLIKI